MNELWEQIEQLQVELTSKPPETPSDVGGVSTLGTGGQARSDHAHRGVGALKEGSDYLYGIIELIEGSGIDITTDSDNLTLTFEVEDPLILGAASIGDLFVDEIHPNSVSPGPGITVWATLIIQEELRADVIGAASQSPSGTVEFIDPVVLASLTISGLTASRIVATDASSGLVSVANLASWVAATTSQTTVSDDGDGTITIGTVQDIDTSSSPEFNGLTLSSLSSNLLIQTGGGNELASVTDLTSWIGGTLNQVDVSNDGDGTVTLSTPQDIHSGASPTFTGLTLSGLTASRLVATDGSSGLSSVASLASWIAGTTNQVIVTSDGDGTVTLSTPQDIDTGATVQFAKLGLGTSTVPNDGVGIGIAAIEGASQSTDGPHLQFSFSDDGGSYPPYAIYNWDHDDIAQCWDAYFDGTNFRASDGGSSFIWQKFGDTLSLYTDSSPVAGEVFVPAGVISFKANASVQTAAGRIVKTTRATTTYTVLLTDHVVFCDTDGGAFTATLPAGVNGQTFKIINCGVSNKALTVAPNGAELLLGANSNFTLYDKESLILTYNTTEGWY